MRTLLPLLALLLLASAQAKADDVLWTYDGDHDGQSDWGDLKPEYALCSGGTKQSPVSISRTVPADLPPLQFDYKTTNAHITPSRYSLATSPASDLHVTEGKTTAALKEMLIRSPSEHDIRGEFIPAEIQLVHTLPDNTFLTVVVLMKEGAENSALKNILANVPRARGEVKDTSIDWQALLPKNRGYYSYNGSLTYPPCTENTQYRVLKNPIEASAEQIKQLTAIIGRNARMAQPLYTRTIFESKE